MSERDDELLRRYRAVSRETPPAALDSAILAASRRAVRASPVPRWAAPVSVAAVLVLALGLVLKVQREAPEAVMPTESRGAPAASSADVAPAAPAAPAALPEVEQAAPAPEPANASPAMPRLAAKHAAKAPVAKPAAPAANPAAPEGKRVEAPARREPLIDATPQADVAAAPRAADAMAAPQAAAATPAAAPPAAAARAAAPPAPLRANAARAPAAAALEKSAAPDPLQRELERIARLREEGRDADADAALATFQREHPDYRIEPAMWDRVRRR